MAGIPKESALLAEARASRAGRIWRRCARTALRLNLASIRCTEKLTSSSLLGDNHHKNKTRTYTRTAVAQFLILHGRRFDHSDLGWGRLWISCGRKARRPRPPSSQANAHYRALLR